MHLCIDHVILSTLTLWLDLDVKLLPEVLSFYFAV